MNKFSKTEIAYLKKAIRHDIADEDNVYKFLLIPIIIALMVFMAIFLMEENSTIVWKAFTACAAVGLIFTAIAEGYRIYFKIRKIQFTSITPAELSSELTTTTKSGLNPFSGNWMIYRHNYYIGKTETYLPPFWYGRPDTEGNKTITVRAFISPWGKAYPVSINNDRIDQEYVTRGIFRLRPINIFWSVFFSLLALLSLISLMPSDASRKTEYLAPFELYQYLRTKDLPSSYTSVNKAFENGLTAYQPISIDSALIIPGPEADEGYSNDLIIPVYPEWIEMVRGFTAGCEIRGRMLGNPGFSKLIKKSTTLPDGTSFPDTIIYENETKRLKAALPELFNAAIKKVDNCFLSDSKTFYDDIFSEYPERKSLYQIYDEIIDLCDTVCTPKAVSGILEPIPQDYSPVKGSFFLNPSRTGYPRFSVFFLSISYVITIIMVMYYLYRIITNRIIIRRIKRFIEDSFAQR